MDRDDLAVANLERDADGRVNLGVADPAVQDVTLHDAAGPVAALDNLIAALRDGPDVPAHDRKGSAFVDGAVGDVVPDLDLVVEDLGDRVDVAGGDRDEQSVEHSIDLATRRVVRSDRHLRRLTIP